MNLYFQKWTLLKTKFPRTKAITLVIIQVGLHNRGEILQEFKKLTHAMKAHLEMVIKV